MVRTDLETSSQVLRVDSGGAAPPQLGDTMPEPIRVISVPEGYVIALQEQIQSLESLLAKERFLRERAERRLAECS